MPPSQDRGRTSRKQILLYMMDKKWGDDDYWQSEITYQWLSWDILTFFCHNHTERGAGDLYAVLKVAGVDSCFAPYQLKRKATMSFGVKQISYKMFNNLRRIISKRDHLKINWQTYALALRPVKWEILSRVFMLSINSFCCLMKSVKVCTRCWKMIRMEKFPNHSHTYVIQVNVCIVFMNTI